MSDTLDIAELRGLEERVARIQAEYDDFDGDRRGIAHALTEAEEKLAEAAIPVMSALLDRADALTAAEAQIAELRAALEVAGEALEPFGAAAEDLDESDPDTGCLWESPAALDMTVGDLRRAATAHATLKARLS